MSPLPRSLTLELVTPDKPIVNEVVDEVQLPGWGGALGILPGHTPLLAMLKPGELWYRKGEEKTYFVLDTGMAEVLPDKVTVLVRLADKPQDIDVIKQEADRRAAEGELQSAVTAEDAERARVAMLTAMVKLRAAERVRMKRGMTLLQNLRNLLKYRGLIQSLVVRDLKARYRGSVLGFFWSFVNPLLLLLIYTFVFTVVLPGSHPKELEPYALFMFCGILPWTWFSSSVLEASNVLISGGNLIKKVLFPAEVLPIVTVLANMVHFFLGLPILLAFLVYFRHPLNLTDLVWFPVVVFTQLLLTVGLSLIVAALTVHFRDLKDLLANLMTLWFFATPIIYPMALAAKVGQGLSKRVLDLNPFTHLAISYQEILFYDGPFGHWKWLLALLVASTGLFLVGYVLFDRLRDSFAEGV